MKDNEPKEKLLIKIYKLLLLEINSEHGKVNAFGALLVTMFILLYCACDWIRFFISNTVDVIKTIYLKTDINHANEGPGFLSVVMPVVAAFGFCLFYLYLQEKRKDEIRLRELELNKRK